MAFEDAAKRMGGKRGRQAGDGATVTDPDQIMADAVKAARRSSKIRDLVLGPILLVGGLVVGALCASTIRQVGIMHMDRIMDALVVSAIVAIVVGSQKILRGIGILKRSE
jgi:hypothetical protein